MEQNNKNQKNGTGLLYAILICTIVSFTCNIITHVTNERQINELNNRINEITAIEDTIETDEPLTDTVIFVGNDSTESAE